MVSSNSSARALVKKDFSTSTNPILPCIYHISILITDRNTAVKVSYMCCQLIQRTDLSLENAVKLA